jgi:hypothetical protein
LLKDFGLGQGERVAAIPAAVLCRPSNAGQAKETRNAVGESKKTVWQRCPLGYRALRGWALACSLTYGLSCSRVAVF